MNQVKRKINTTDGDDAVNDCLQYQLTTLNDKSTIKQELIFVKNEYCDLIIGIESKHWYKDKEIYDNYDDVLIPNENAKSFRDWLVKQVPFTKQELIDMMTEVSR